MGADLCESLSDRVDLQFNGDQRKSREYGLVLFNCGCDAGFNNCEKRGRL